MANVTMDVLGMDAIMSRLQELDKAATKTINTSLKAGADIVLVAMRENVPVSHDGGLHIRDDIIVNKPKGSGLNRYITIGPGKRTNWRAKFIEFGTSKMTAQPFMLRSLTENRSKVQDLIREKLKEGLGL